MDIVNETLVHFPFSNEMSHFDTTTFPIDNQQMKYDKLIGIIKINSKAWIIEDNAFDSALIKKINKYYNLKTI